MTVVHSKHVPLGHRRATKHNAYARSQGRETSPISSELVAAHIEKLRSWNMTVVMIAEAAGCGNSIVAHIRQGIFETTRRSTAQRILSVGPTPHPDQTKCLAIGAIRRVHALQALGWRLEDISERTELTASQLKGILGEVRISYSRWKAIAEAYEPMSAAAGPSTPTRARARRLGYAPPLAWEGRHIDHPEAQPDWRAAGYRRGTEPVCKHGHRYTPENTVRDNRGRRQCVTCRRATDARKCAA